MGFEDFAEFAERATGKPPYGYQTRAALDGLPQLLIAPTGAGKTAAAVLAWLWRRRFHPDQAIRATTPRRLVFALPMRVLVEQTARVVREWIHELDLDEQDPVHDRVAVHVLMGGSATREERRQQRSWRDRPEQDAVIVGTIDMLLSRALNRGYAESRYAWPMSFAWLSNDAHWVFDEVQLLGPALPTSRQLDAFRRSMGTVAPTASTWMSATVDEPAMSTVDNRDVGSRLEVTPSDLDERLRPRMEAPKTVRELRFDAKSDAAYLKGLAQAALDEHEQHGQGRRTLVVVNTVERAQGVYQALGRLTDIPRVLLHSRFRPPERAAKTDLVINDPDERGMIVVSTQVIEAGVDITSETLVTEAASWASIVQRAGRCNRYGEAAHAQILWTSPKAPHPYSADDVERSIAALRALEGQDVTPISLRSVEVEPDRPVWPVLRRRDLVGLFDTTPDLSGNDLDVGRYVRADGGLDVQVAWRSLRKDEEGRRRPDLEQGPVASELCAVPFIKMREWLRVEGHRAWVFDHLQDQWVPAFSNMLRPGQILVVAADDGGYDPELGWTGNIGRTEPIDAPKAEDAEPIDEAMEADPMTLGQGRWVPLLEHLKDTADMAAALLGDLENLDISDAHQQATVIAAGLHDLGKAHHAFQEALAQLVPESERGDLKGDIWAKSDREGRLRYPWEHRYFRHELATALALLGDGKALLEGVDEWELTVYLTAAHHGKVRTTIRALPEEQQWNNSGGEAVAVAMGVRQGDTLPEVEVPDGSLPGCRLDLGVVSLGGGHRGGQSWAQMTAALRDRADLGPFRLAYLEAVVRIADWRASDKERRHV